MLATTLPETAWNLGWTLQGVNVGLAEPCWATGLVVDAGGRVYYAVGGDGRIRILTSDDQGRTWRLRTCPRPPRPAGRRNARCGRSWSRATGLSPCCSMRSTRRAADKTAGNTVAVSFDRGATWSGPRAVNAHRWSIAPIIARYNGPGLRDSGVLLADGRTIYFAYGDGRDGYSGASGRASGSTPAPTPAPTPTPTPTPTAATEPTPTATTEATPIPDVTPPAPPDATPTPTPVLEPASTPVPEPAATIEAAPA